MERRNDLSGKSENNSGSAAGPGAWWVGQPAELPDPAATKRGQAAEPEAWWLDQPGAVTPPAPAGLPAPVARPRRRWLRAAPLLLLLVIGLAAVAAWHVRTRRPRPEPVAVAPAAPGSSSGPAEEAAPGSSFPPAPAEKVALAAGPPVPPTRKEASAVVGPRLAPEELLAVAPAASAPAPAKQTALATVPRGARSEADLLKDLAGVPEVGLTPPELHPLVEAWAAAFQASYDEPTRTVSYEPLPLLQQRPDLVQLPLRQGRATRLTPREAQQLQTLSERLHGYLDRLTAANCGSCHTVDLRLDIQRLASHASEPPADLRPLRELLREEKEGKRPVWRRPEAVATLQQILMPESAHYRRLLVELLDEIGGKKAVAYLAQRAVFDLSPEVRRRAVEALRKRPAWEYRKALLAALRYPWPPAAEHAAEALVALKDQEAVPHLVGLLKEPDPSAPVRLKNDRYVVPQMVRLRHTFNCLACHPPAAQANEPVPGAVPGINLTRVVTLTRLSPRERASLIQMTKEVIAKADFG